MLKARLIFTSALLLASVTAMADKTVEQTQCNVTAIASPGEAAAATLEAKKTEKPVTAAVQPPAQPAVVTFTEHQLSGDVGASMMELIKMMVPTRATGFSYKDMQGKDQGEIVLGVELQSKYTLELVYMSDYREENRFVLDKILLIDRNGRDEPLSKNPLQSDGSIVDKLEIDPQAFPELANLKYNVPIFSSIDASIVDELEHVGPRLEKLDKDELRALTKHQTYASVKAILHLHSAWKTTKKFLVQRIARQGIQVVMTAAGTAAIAYLAVMPAVDHELQLIAPHKHHVEAVVPAASTLQMPPSVQKEVATLDAGFQKNGTVTLDRAHYAEFMTWVQMNAAQQATVKADKPSKKKK